MPVVSNIKLKLLGAVMLNFCIRVICLLGASLMATHALSQDMSGWSDKTVCRLVESDGGAAYLEEASSRGLDCKAPIETPKVKAVKSTPSNSYTSNGRPVNSYTKKGDVTIFDSWELPQYLKPAPTDATLAHYFKKWLDNRYFFDSYDVQPAGNATKFESQLKTNTFLTDQMQTKSLVSYLYYEDGKIIHDEMAPIDRSNYIQVDDKTELRSASVGKSVVSYIAGHAICEGYIGGLDVKMNDWPLIENTLYENQKFNDVLNMRAGDQNVVTEGKGFIKSGRWLNSKSIKAFADYELKGTKPSNNRKYNYNGFATNLAMNYVIFKTGDDWQSLLDKIFQDKVKIENKFFFFKHWRMTDEEGLGWYNFYATRYDYLRIAKAMLDDWNNDTCVGQYLKAVYDRRLLKNHGYNDRGRMTDSAKGYGGYFHFDFSEMRNRTILGMNGYGGQVMMIDFDNSRIVVVNSVTTNYDWYELAHQVIKNGKLKE